jgi:hypothetical protein
MALKQTVSQSRGHRFDILTFRHFIPLPTSRLSASHA